ncbi:MAG: hypothetical protein HYV63_34365 [Candidatus Schekmanbacteria bacterium]|nr:hypothetical protein [Candidatus Schekmanbacteria bacterium]
MSSMRLVHLSAGAVVVVFLALAASPAQPYPLFAAKHGADCVACHDEAPLKLEGQVAWSKRKCSLHCNSCHLNQSGGGLRNSAARYYATARGSSFVLPIFTRLEPRRQALGKYFQFGLDLRTAYVKQQGRSYRFFPMQADLYLAVMPIRHLTIYYQDGRTPVDIPSRKELFVQLDELPYMSHVKVGRFLPPFGLRYQDHTAFVRGWKGDGQGLGAWDYVEGVEIGTNPVIPFLDAAYFTDMGNEAFGRNPKGYSINLGSKLLHRRLELSYGAGVSLLAVDADDKDTRMWGVHGALGIWRLAGLVEWNKKTVSDDLSGLDFDSKALFGLINVQVHSGVDFFVQYDFWDPDVIVKDDHRHRYSVGTSLHLLESFEWEVRYRFDREGPGREVDNDTFLFQTHFWL